MKLRRRTLGENKTDENIAYLDSGYILPQSDGGDAWSEPYYRSTRPDSCVTTAVPILTSDSVALDYSDLPSGSARIWFYLTDGTYYAEGAQSWSAFTVEFDGYVRFEAIYGVGSLNGITVAHADSTITKYKVVDRR